MQKKYQIIYADPPWRYDFSKSDSRRIEKQYQTMSVEEIKKLVIPTEKNAICFLWTTTAKLIEGLDVLKSWGFTYKSSLVWDKETIGMGFWFRGQHEFLLVGTKGKMPPPEQKKRISSVYRERKTKHSKKPNYIRDQIALWYPNKSKLEMFCRYAEVGWDVFGNEVEGSITINSIA